MHGGRAGGIGVGGQARACGAAEAYGGVGEGVELLAGGR